MPYIDTNTNARAVYLVNGDPTSPNAGAPSANGNSYTLASNATLAENGTTAPVTGVAGGSYIWAYQFGGTTPSLILESLGPDGVNYLPIATVTASGTMGVVIGNNATVRLRNATADAISGLSSNLT